MDMDTKRVLYPPSSPSLSPLEQRIYQRGIGSRFFHLHDMDQISGNKVSIRRALSCMARKGYVIRVKKGFYATVPMEHLGRDYQVDSYGLIYAMFDGSGAIAFHSAMELHGFAHSYFNTRYYVDGKQHRTLRFQGITYRPVYSYSVFGLDRTVRDGVTLRMTDKERTFLDCVRRPDLCGGLEEMMKSFDMMGYLNSERFAEYLSRFDELSLYQKAGFILDILKDSIQVEKELLTHINSKIGKDWTALAPGIDEDLRRDDRWKVLYPNNLDEMMQNV